MSQFDFAGSLLKIMGKYESLPTIQGVAIDYILNRNS